MHEAGEPDEDSSADASDERDDPLLRRLAAAPPIGLHEAWLLLVDRAAAAAQLGNHAEATALLLRALPILRAELARAASRRR